MTRWLPVQRPSWWRRLRARLRCVGHPAATRENASLVRYATRNGPAVRSTPGARPTPTRGADVMSESYRVGGAQEGTRYKKRAIPQATRRAVALAAGGVPGESVAAACTYCGIPGAIHWQRLHCGRPGGWVYFSGLELDHIHPERLGGSSTPDNIVLACPRCNRSRGFRHRLPPRMGRI